jgi:hypothetical protein
VKLRRLIDGEWIDVPTSAASAPARGAARTARAAQRRRLRGRIRRRVTPERAAKRARLRGRLEGGGGVAFLREAMAHLIEQGALDFLLEGD